MFKNALKYSDMRINAQQCSEMLKNFEIEHFSILAKHLSNPQKCSAMLNNVQKCSETLRYANQCSIMLRNAEEF